MKITRNVNKELKLNNQRYLKIITIKDKIFLEKSIIKNKRL